ncbi:hypothetical protein Godav_022098 [Gossypium davidsonii]|uniref:RING-type E3 ubiquitin transferase n=2 Tax=Gossypium TaxID=3633 RepID=A0A7J8TGC8_GOSDV|nr:hypothetical protein [Gossypium davidsonii]MBA0667969.1 hypothetical protein [Gossypium klotzschianum]
MAEKEESSAAGGGREEELKKELQSVVKKIVDEDNYGTEITLKAISILSDLSDTVLTKKFRCPISGEIMGDPVVLSSGLTYDRPSIQKWLNEGNLTCPQSKEVLSHTILTPNCLVRKLISSWCKGHGVAVPRSHQDTNGEMITEFDRLYFNSLVTEMFSSLTDRKEAAKELRRLTTAAPSYRAVFFEFTDPISRLIGPLLEGSVDSDPELQEDLITTFMNLLVDCDNMKPVADHPDAIPLLIKSVEFGTIETRKNAAVALSMLSSDNDRRLMIGNAGAPMPLLQLLREGHPIAMKEAASAILNQCVVYNNKEKFIELGAVKVLLEKIREGKLVDELINLVAQLSTHPKAVNELSELDTVHCLLGIIRETESERTKENCVAILYNVCLNDVGLLKVIWTEGIEHQTLAKLVDTGTARAKRKATALATKIGKLFPTVL